MHENTKCSKIYHSTFIHVHNWVRVAAQMSQLEEDELKVTMEKATNYETLPVVMESSKMFTKATSANPKYSEEERKLLNSYHSMDYLPPHSQVTKEFES